MNHAGVSPITILVSALLAFAPWSSEARETDRDPSASSDTFFEIAPHAAIDLQVMETGRRVEVHLPNRNQVHLLRLDDKQGDVVGVGVLELRRAATRSIKTVLALNRSSPVDVFFALTRPGTQLPDVLRTVYGDRPPPPRQGWALEALASDDDSVYGPMGACEGHVWEDFAEPMLAYGYPHVELNKASGPTTAPDQWDVIIGWDPIGNGDDYRSLKGSGHEITKIALSVQWCEGDERPHWMEPVQVFVDVRPPDQGWTLVVSTALWDVGDEVNFQYAPVLFGAEQTFDVRMRVSFALWDDLFNLGVTWEQPAGFSME